MNEKIFFENSKGQKLCGILSNPTSLKDKPVIVLCHGFSTSKDGRTYVRLEEILNNSGISTLRFDFFGHGESEGKFEELTLSEAIDDIQKAIKLLKDAGYTKIGLFGSSFGGMASIVTASDTHDLYVLALKSPVSDYLGILLARISEQELKDWKKDGVIHFTGTESEHLKLNYSFFEDTTNISAYDMARKIKIPTLIVHGNKDETVPVEQSKKTADLIENCQLKIIEGGDHTYSKAQDFEKLLDLVSKFIIQNS